MKITWVRFLLLLLLFIGFLPSSKVQAQSHAIWVSGQVLKEKDKTPIAGVSVLLKRTGEGTATNEQGQFRIRILTSDTLLFSSIGYQDKRYVPSLRSVTELRVNILLQEASVQLETVEVGPGLDPEKVDRVVRNMKARPAKPAPKMGAGVPKVIVKPTPPSSEPPSGLTAISSPATFLYESFSKDAKSRRRVVKLTEEKAAELKRDSIRQARLRYNRFFRDTVNFKE